MDSLQKAYDMVLQSWIINSLKIYKIYDEVIKFVKKTMENWRAKIDSKGKILAEVKILREIFQGDALSSLRFVIAKMPLNHMLRKCTSGCKLTKSQEKINHLMYMNDIKLFAKNEKELETLNSENIQSGYRE